MNWKQLMKLLGTISVIIVIFLKSRRVLQKIVYEEIIVEKGSDLDREVNTVDEQKNKSTKEDENKDEYECTHEDCPESFGTKRGRNIHEGMVH